MTSNQAHDIVVGIDGSSGSEHALEWAIAEASRVGCGLTLVHGLAPIPPNERALLLSAGAAPDEVQRDARREAVALLEGSAKQVAQREAGLQVATIVCDRDPREALTALSENARQLVVGSRGHGPLVSLLLGSVGHGVIRTSRCPVVVVRPPSPHEPEPVPGVVAALSVLAGSRSTLAAAFVEAEARGVPVLVAFSAWDAYSAVGGWEEAGSNAPEFDALRESLAGAVAVVSRDHPAVAVSTIVVQGAVNESILDLSRGRDLLVVGRHGAHGLRGILGPGSNATTLVEHAHVPVMVVP